MNRKQYIVLEENNGSWQTNYENLGGDWIYIRRNRMTYNYDAAISFAKKLTAKNGRNHKVMKRTISFSAWEEA